MIDLRKASGAEDFDRARELFVEYGEGLPADDRAFQDFDGELSRLETMYTLPDGVLILAQAEDDLVGCVGLRQLEPGVCEMKRLYVRPSARKRGLGRLLAEHAVETAIDLGYTHVRLDTLPAMTVAQEMYESMRFRRIEPYNDTPVAGMVFMELILTPASG